MHKSTFRSIGYRFQPFCSLVVPTGLGAAVVAAADPVLLVYSPINSRIRSFLALLGDFDFSVKWWLLK